MYKFIDYYSVRPQILFLNSETFPTKSGAFITICILTLTFLTLSNFSQNFLYKTEPFILNTRKNHELNPKISFKDIPFTISLLYNYQEYIDDPSIIQYKAAVRSISTLSDGTITLNEKKLDLKKCTPNDFTLDNSIQESLRAISFERHFCFNFSSAEIEGAWGTKKFDVIAIDFLRCVNNSNSNVICKSKEHIDQILNNSNFGLNFLNSQIDPENYNLPVRKTIETPYTISDPGLAKEYQIFLEIGKVVTDKGWVISDKSEERFVRINREKETSGLMGRLGPNIFSSFFIRVTSEEFIVLRKYDKIQDVLASLGKFYKLF
jgi:hypothetical protein